MTPFSALSRLLFPFVLLAAGTAAAVDATPDLDWVGEKPAPAEPRVRRTAMEFAEIRPAQAELDSIYANRDGHAELVGLMIDRGAEFCGMSVDIFD